MVPGSASGMASADGAGGIPPAAAPEAAVCAYRMEEGFMSAVRLKCTPSGWRSMLEKIGLATMPFLPNKSACRATAFTLSATPVILMVIFCGSAASKLSERNETVVNVTCSSMRKKMERSEEHTSELQSHVNLV